MARSGKEKKWTEAEMMAAKDLYMEFLTTTEIAAKTGIPRTTLQYHISQYWKIERAMASSEIIKEWREANKPNMSKITRNSLKIMDRALQHLSKRPEPPTMKEAIDASKVFDTMDKIARLDKAEGVTEIKEQLNSSELIERLKSADPFFEQEGDKNEEETTN